MLLNKGKFALNGSVAMGAVYIVCSVFVFVFPETSLKLMSALTHLDLIGKFGGEMRVTFGGFISGLLQVVIYSYLLGYIIAHVLNKSAAERR